MSTTSYAVIDVASGLIVNSVVWDGESLWEPGPGLIAVQLTPVHIGWIYNAVTGEQVPPEEALE